MGTGLDEPPSFAVGAQRREAGSQAPEAQPGGDISKITAIPIGAQTSSLSANRYAGLGFTPSQQPWPGTPGGWPAERASAREAGQNRGTPQSLHCGVEPRFCPADR